MLDLRFSLLYLFFLRDPNRASMVSTLSSRTINLSNLGLHDGQKSGNANWEVLCEADCRNWATLLVNPKHLW